MEKQTRFERLSIQEKWKRAFVIFPLVGLLVVTVVIVNSCAVVPRHRPVRTVVVKEPDGTVDVVYVQKAPPKPRTEVRPKKPNAGAIWIPGHWQWTGGKYTWISGHWDANPRGKVWEPGHWEKRPRGWIWVTGHWR